MPDHSSATQSKPYLEHLLALDQLPLGRVRVSPAEIDVIRGVLAEGAVAAKRFNLSRAMFIAADNAPDEKTAALIANILNDRAADGALRLQAAAMLGDLPVQSASRSLIAALAGSPSALEAALLESLAKVGDAEAARAIDARPDAASPALGRLRNFARAAILYRYGACADERADNAILPIGTAVKVDHESPTNIEAAVRRLRGSNYGLHFNPELGYSLSCGGARHLVLLSSDLKRGDLVRSLGAARRIAGIVAMADGDDGSSGNTSSYVARGLIVTRPERKGIGVSVLGTDGRVHLLGAMRPVADGLALSLHSRGNVGPPIAVDGALTNDEIVLVVRAFGYLAASATGEVDPIAA